MTVICCRDEVEARLSGSVKFPRRDRESGDEGELQVNQRTSGVSQAVAALAMLATVALVPTEAQVAPGAPGVPNGHRFKVRCCIPEDGQVECGQLTPDNCDRVGGTNIGPGSCAMNPCRASSTTTTTPASTTTTTQAPTTTPTPQPPTTTAQTKP